MDNARSPIGAFVFPSLPIPKTAYSRCCRSRVNVSLSDKLYSTKVFKATLHHGHSEDISYSSCPLNLNSPSFVLHPFRNDNQEECSQIGNADLPPGGGSYGSSGSRDHHDGNDDPNDFDKNAVLKTFGKTEAEIPSDLRVLSASQLSDYLQATKAGVGAWLARSWPGWRRRVAADPEFPFKVLMEETVGLGLAASGMIAARGKKILSELDLAFCDIAVGGTLNFILVYLLAPVVGASASRVSTLPANLFAKGSYPLHNRLLGFLYKGTLFSICGFAGSIVGSTLSQSLITARRLVTSLRHPDQQLPDKPLPNVFTNSLAWAGFMFVSSNPRYQTVAGAERILFTVAPDSVAKVSCALLRTANNVLGGAFWVWWAKTIGLQKSDETSVE